MSRATTVVRPLDEDPVVAEVEGVRLRWHARAVRGDRTLVEAATLCGLNRDELGKIERGETKQIRFTTIAKMLAGYQCTLSDLMEAETQQTATPRPLYAGALAALQDGVLQSEAPTRRSARRPTSEDVLGAVDEEAFSSAPAPTGRRRRPIGTLVR